MNLLHIDSITLIVYFGRIKTEHQKETKPESIVTIKVFLLELDSDLVAQKLVA